MPADAELLLELMDAAGIAGALIVQPIVHGFDHRYVSDTIARWPDRFAGMALIDPRHQDPPLELERLVREEGYRGVRFNPRLWPPGERMDGDVGMALFSKAGELAIPVGFLVEPAHFSQVEALCAAFPAARAIIDHFGHCKIGPQGGLQPDFQQLVDMSVRPNIYVKLSEFPRASQLDWPYLDTGGWVRRLLATYGRERLMWGTDFPYVLQQCGYAEGWAIAEEISPPLAEDEREWVLGRTAQELFGGWSA